MAYFPFYATKEGIVYMPEHSDASADRAMDKLALAIGDTVRHLGIGAMPYDEAELETRIESGWYRLGRMAQLRDRIARHRAA